MYYKYAIDSWLRHRFTEVPVPGIVAPASFVVDLLPEGYDSLYNGLAPEAVEGTVQYPILSFWEAGINPTTCLGTIKDGVMARYHTRLFHADPSFSDFAPILDAIEGVLIAADGNGVSEVYNGLLFNVTAQIEEMGDIGLTRAGTLYARGGFRWELDVAPAV